MISINTKYCYKCDETKSHLDFHKNKTEKDGLYSACKVCHKEYNDERKKTKEGLISRIYSSQKTNSKTRNHVMPNYSLTEFMAWVLGQPVFHELYSAWVDSGFSTMLIPSCDRRNDYEPYTLEKLQIMTWQENKRKYYSDIKKGVNRKALKPVVQMTIDGLFISEHYSINHAERVTGVKSRNISKCVSGKRKSTGGFRWMISLGAPINNNMCQHHAGNLMRT